MVERKPEDFGWIVEIDIAKKTARKLTTLGHFNHEGATVVVAKNKNIVVYLGDDARSQCLYKFVSKGHLSGDNTKDRDLLLEGNLYVADFRNTRWVKLSPDNENLAKDS